MANYNLPGVYTFYKERGLLATPAVSERVTDEILLIGTAHDGPKNVPVRVERPQDAINLFGDPGMIQNGGSLLVPAFREAYYAGARNIYLMRITGEEAKLEIEDVMTIMAPYPGSKYNNIMVSIEVGEVNPENPDEEPEAKLYIWNKEETGANTLEELKAKKIDTRKYEIFDLNGYKSLHELAKDIVYRAGIGVEVKEGAGIEDLIIADVADQPLAGGSDQAVIGEDIELGKYSSVDEFGDPVPGEGYRAALEAAYDLIVDYNVKTVVPLGVYVGFDETKYDRTDADVLVNFCYTAARRNNDITAVINVRPFKGVSLADVKEEVDALYKVADNRYISEDNVDIGKYLSIVAGEGIFSDQELGTYTNTLSAAYAGLVSTLPIQSGSTNKVINGIASLRYNLSPAQAGDLRDKRFTVIRNKFNRGVTVVEGLVASLPTSDFQSLSTVRVVHGVMNAIREVVDPFIGEALDIPHITSLENAISGRLDKFVDDGALTSASFQILFPQNAAIMGDVRVALELGIASELRRILVTVSRSVTQIQR